MFFKFNSVEQPLEHEVQLLISVKWIVVISQN